MSAPLEFDSAALNVQVFRADSPDEWNLGGCTCLLLDADDTLTIADAETKGFHFTDVRVELERKTEMAAAATVHADDVRDTEALARIARVSHRITRFYADPRFDDEKCDDFYERWIRNSLDGWADAVLTVREFSQPIGYVTVHLEDDGTARIGLIAVTESARSRGFGNQLVFGALDWARENGAASMKVVTQGRNRQALRLFERCGFLNIGTGLWFHRWLS